MVSPSLCTTRRGVLGLSVAAMIGVAPRAAGAAADGQITIGAHVSLAPTWFDPAETSGIITPFMLLYAMHDAMMKAMPDNPMAPCLAESWTMAPDGLSYAFTLRKGVLFHNGEALTAEDVKFSLERYRGAANKTLKERVAGVDIHDPHRLTIRLNEPWPDFLTFYAGATGAGWIVPKKYVQQVGEDGFKKAPIGAGPYKFVSFNPGVELVCEAFEGYWRKAPAIKRLVFKVVPDEATRLAALQRGEIDIAYSIRGELADELTRTPGLTIKPARGIGAVLALLPGSVGSAVAVARSARAPGDQPRAGPQDDQPGADARLLAPDGQHLPGEFRILLAAAGAGVRSRSAPASCWPRPGICGASMPGIITAMPPTPISARSC